MMNNALLKASILSISLLTVMASAAVSPALAKIKQAFPAADITLIKLILTLPSLFIIPASLLSGVLVRRMKKKHVLLIGLVIYFIGGIGGGFSTTITQLLVIRALFGIGAGLIIPLSTSLIADFFEGDARTKMMGYSGSLSHFGGVVFLLISGWLACMSWRYAFYVYGLSVLTFLLILFCLPEPVVKKVQGAPQQGKLPFGIYVCALLGALMMIAFYAAPTNLAMYIENDRRLYTSQKPLFKDKEEFIAHVTAGTISDRTRESFKEQGIILSDKASLSVIEPDKSWGIVDRNNKFIVTREPDKLVISSEKLGRPGIAGYFLSTMTLVGVVSGLVLVQLLRMWGTFCTPVSIFSMAVGYWLLGTSSSLPPIVAAMLCIGFSSGVLMPLLLLRVAQITPQASRAMSMAVLSIGVYLGQFLSPVVLKAAGNLTMLGRDQFRAQFFFLAICLLVSAGIGLVLAVKNRGKGLSATASSQIKVH
jgi:MFS family permease